MQLLEIIKNVFQIKNEEFADIFHDACLGKGQEYKEILRLHSSSLCPLLFFKVYQRLAENLNSENKNIKVLSEPLKYSMFKTNGYELNSKIKNFYFGK